MNDEPWRPDDIEWEKERDSAGQLRGRIGPVEVIEVGGAVIDLGRREVRAHGAVVDLTGKEFELLRPERQRHHLGPPLRADHDRHANRSMQVMEFTVQLHLRPSGKPEHIQPAIGLYFTDDPPQRTLARLRAGMPTLIGAPNRPAIRFAML